MSVLRSAPEAICSDRVLLSLDPNRTWGVLNGNDGAAAFGPTKVPSLVARMDAIS
jgi:hypothetical protein